MYKQERTWQSLRKLAQSMLVHALLPDMCLYHDLLHACHVFNVLPFKNMVTSGVITTLYELFVGPKPKVSHSLWMSLYCQEVDNLSE